MTATQPSQSQREVRGNLNTILHIAKEKRHELGAGTGEQVAELLNQAEGFNGEIHKPQEEVIVSEILVIAAQTGHAVLKKLAQGGKSYTPADYIRSLKSHYVNDTDAQIVGAEDPYAFNWVNLGNSIAGWFRPAPCSFHMLGPMDAAAKTKKVVAQRRKKGVIAEAVRPDDVVVGGEEQQQTDRNMNIVFNVVREHEGCLLTELVLNHASFAQTVENLFALSFLIRDRRVKLSECPEGVRVYKATPVVKKKKTDRGQHGADGGGGAAGGNAEDEDAERFQFVVTFSEYEWNKWKEVTNEEDTLMPHREQAQQQDQPPAQQQRRQPPKGKKRRQESAAISPDGKRGPGRPPKPVNNLTEY